MSDSPVAREMPRSRRWRRKLGFLTLGTLLPVIGLGVATWVWRVPLLNRVLASRNSVWKIQVESADPAAGGLRVSGLRVSHVNQVEPVFTAARLEVNAGWRELRHGRLGNVTMESPAVYWRAGLDKDPEAPGSSLKVLNSTVPLVSWESLQITQGRIDAADPGSFSFKGELSGKGGAGAWFKEGRLNLAPQELSLGAPDYTMTLAEGPIRSIAVEARQLDLRGSLDADSGILTLTQAHFTGALARLAVPQEGETGDSATPAPMEIQKTAPDPGPQLIAGVRLGGLTALSMKCEATLPWRLATSGDLAVAQLLAGPGAPFTMSGIRYSKATAVLPGDAGIAQCEIVASYREAIPWIDSLTFSGAEIPDLAGLLRTLGLSGLHPATVSFSAAGDLKDLPLSDAWSASAANQQITIQNLKLALPELGKVTLARAVIAGVPDEIASARRFRRLELDAPVVELILPAQPLAAEVPLAGFSAALIRKGKENTSGPWWEGWTADTLTVNDGHFEATLPQAEEVRVTTRLKLETTSPDKGEAGAVYQIMLDQPQLTHSQFPGPPIVLASSIQLTASTSGLWQKREFDALVITGTRLQINNALFRLVNAFPTASPALFQPAKSLPDLPLLKSPPWHLKRLVLDQSLIQIDNLGGRSRLDIPIKRQEFPDLPLDASALAAVDRVYKIEVPNITFYSPFNAGQKVATLDTNFIQFTPSGLLQRKLERVDIMAPTLYAGQPLFDFVDAARKRFADLATAPANTARPLLADVGARSPTVLSALASITPSLAAAAAEWDIPFYMESGKVLVAPKGFPWPGLPVFPFRNARDPAGKPIPFHLRGETFHGELAIEPRWYDFPEYKVRLLLSERGRIIFNTPQKDRENNLTEVFENNTLIFRQLEIAKAWLSVTYDARGIYARFGGHTCGGVLNGGFNLYLDELYTWDAWVSLTGIGMKPLTDKLSPDTFRMTGPVDELTVKAFGDITTLYQASVDLKVTRPGQLHLLALDALQDRIKALGGLSADLGKISVETLRDFAYTGCTGNLKLFGSEGTGQLQLIGPGGSRTFNLRLHDYRAKTPKTVAPF